MELQKLVRAVPDFPMPGIVFRDITPLLLHPTALRHVVQTLSDRFAGEVDLVVAVESRGFIFGAPLAMSMGCGFAPVRKLGKLPRETVSREYALEYGSNHLEIHRDAVAPGQRLLIVDDVLATGGTAAAALGLVEELGGRVAGFAFVIELSGLNGRLALQGKEVFSLITY